MRETADLLLQGPGISRRADIADFDPPDLPSSSSAADTFRLIELIQHQSRFLQKHLTRGSDCD